MKWRKIVFCNHVMHIIIKMYFSISSEPPVPTTVPRLLEKGSNHLKVMPMDSYRGDGPIVTYKLLYKPEGNGDSWSSIIGRQTVKDVI